MPSATVDQVVVQVTGALVISLVGVLWLWIADVRRWWPFNQGLAVEALLAHGAESESARVLTPGFETVHHHHPGRRQRAGTRWGARIAARSERRIASRGEHTRRGLRRDARALVLVS